MSKVKKGRFIVDVLYFEEWNLCKLLRVINPLGTRFHLEPDTTVKIEKNVCEDDLCKSKAFLEFMKENYGFTEKNRIVVIQNADDCLC